jgi:hypothetical protein
MATPTSFLFDPLRKLPTFDKNPPPFGERWNVEAPPLASRFWFRWLGGIRDPGSLQHNVSQGRYISMSRRIWIYVRSTLTFVNQ